MQTLFFEVENLLISWVTVSLSKSTLLHGISKEEIPSLLLSADDRSQKIIRWSSPLEATSVVLAAILLGGGKLEKL
jgi:hypothetical protein